MKNMFEGKMVSLRSLEFEDLELLKKWRNMKHVRKSTRGYRLLNMINQKNWFEKIHKNNPPLEIMFGIINKQKKMVGVTGLTYIDWKNRHSEISIYFSDSGWQKRSEAKDVINLIMKYGFEELNLNRLWVEIYETTVENIELFEKMKFVKEAHFRQKVWRQRKWWDSVVYSILANEYYAKKN